jgi:hypothetical protein
MSNTVDEVKDRGGVSLILDDGQGHPWHVPFDEVKCVPRVGEIVRLPPDLCPHEVLSAEHHFLQQGPPVTLHGEWSSDLLYARPSRVVLKVRRV